MKRRFQILIEGTVRSNPDDQLSSEGTLKEMRKAVEDSFKPDLQWGVTYNVLDVLILEGVRRGGE